MARTFTDGGTQTLASIVGRIANISIFSAAFWLYRTATPVAERGIIAVDAATATEWVIKLTAANLLRVVFTYTVLSKDRTSTSISALNAWTHIVVTHSNISLNSTDFLFYFNGQQEAGTDNATGSGTHDVTTPCALEIGNDLDGNAAPPAAIGPIALWNRVISPSEALALAGGAHPLRFQPGLVEMFDMNTPNVEAGWLSNLNLVPGATIPALSSQANPLMEGPPLWPLQTRQNVRPMQTTRARYFAGAGAVAADAIIHQTVYRGMEITR